MDNTNNLFTIDNELLTKKIKRSSIACRRDIEKNMEKIINNSLIDSLASTDLYSYDEKNLKPSHSFISNNSFSLNESKINKSVLSSSVDEFFLEEYDNVNEIKEMDDDSNMDYQIDLTLDELSNRMHQENDLEMKDFCKPYLINS